MIHARRRTPSGAELIHMELRHLRYFVAVADEMSVTRAALKLRLAQPSLTRQIRRLEEELHVELFHRENNRITLTEGGRFFLERTRRLLAQSDADLRDLRRHELGENGSLRIGYVADLHYDLLPTTLGAFRKVWPDVALNLLDLTVAEQFEALAADRIDLCFAGEEARLPADMGWQRQRITEGNWMVVVPGSSALAKGKPLGIQDLETSPFITMDDAFYPGARDWLRSVCGAAGFTPKIAYEVDRVPTMIGLVTLELGVALLPENCMKLPHEGAVFRPLTEGLRSRVEIVWKQRTLSRPLEHYIEIVRERFETGHQRPNR